MDETKKHLIIELLIKHELKSVDVYSIMNDIEAVVDSKYQTFTEAVRDFEEWTDDFPSDQVYEIKQTEHTFEVRLHHEKQRYMSW